VLRSGRRRADRCGAQSKRSPGIAGVRPLRAGRPRSQGNAMRVSEGGWKRVEPFLRQRELRAWACARRSGVSQGVTLCESGFVWESRCAILVDDVSGDGCCMGGISCIRVGNCVAAALGLSGCRATLPRRCPSCRSCVEMLSGGVCACPGASFIFRLLQESWSH